MHPHSLLVSVSFPKPGKCLYTTIRELVENALDSAESIGMLPLIEITVWVDVCCNGGNQISEGGKEGRITASGSVHYLL